MRPRTTRLALLGFSAVAAWSGCSGGAATNTPSLPLATAARVPDALDANANAKALATAGATVTAKPTSRPTLKPTASPTPLPTPTPTPTNAPCSAPDSAVPGTYISVAAAGTLASGIWTIAKYDGVDEGAADVVAYAAGTPLPSASPKETPTPKSSASPTAKPSATPTATPTGTTSSVYAGEYALTAHTSYPTKGCFAIAVPKGQTSAAFAAGPRFGTLDLSAKQVQQILVVSLSVKLAVGGTGTIRLADGSSGTLAVQSLHTETTP